MKYSNWKIAKAVIFTDCGDCFDRNDPYPDTADPFCPLHEVFNGFGWFPGTLFCRSASNASEKQYKIVIDII